MFEPGLHSRHPKHRCADRGTARPFQHLRGWLALLFTRLMSGRDRSARTFACWILCAFSPAASYRLFCYRPRPRKTRFPNTRSTTAPVASLIGFGAVSRMIWLASAIPETKVCQFLPTSARTRDLEPKAGRWPTAIETLRDMGTSTRAEKRPPNAAIQICPQQQANPPRLRRLRPLSRQRSLPLVREHSKLTFSMQPVGGSNSHRTKPRTPPRSTLAPRRIENEVHPRGEARRDGERQTHAYSWRRSKCWRTASGA